MPAAGICVVSPHVESGAVLVPAAPAAPPGVPCVSPRRKPAGEPVDRAWEIGDDLLGPAPELGKVTGPAVGGHRSAPVFETGIIFSWTSSGDLRSHRRRGHASPRFLTRLMVLQSYVCM